MFDKSSFFSHIKSINNNTKMTRAGVKTSFYEEREDIQEEEAVVENTLTEQGLRDMIKLMVIGKEEERGEKTPGRGSEPTDHHSVGGKPRRDTGRVTRRPGDDSVLNRIGRAQVAKQYRTGKRYDPDYRRGDAERDLYSKDDMEMY